MEPSGDSTDLKKLILHLDINKTIMMKDSVKFTGSLERTTMILLASSSWGMFNPSTKTWKLASLKLYHPLEEGEIPLEFTKEEEDLEITYGCPKPELCELLDQEEKDTLNAPTKGERLLTYKEFMLQLYPFVKSEDEPDFEKRKEKSIANREMRGKMFDNFITDENSYAWGLRKMYDDLLDRMRVHTKVDKDHRLAEYLHEYYSIIPSFFHLHHELMTKKANEPDFDFRIVFRTFGIDHEAVSTEFRHLIIGDHPLFDNYHPTGLSESDEYAHYGKIFRSFTDQEDIVLIMGIMPCEFEKDMQHKLREIIFGDKPADEIREEVIEYLEEKSIKAYNKANLKFLKGPEQIQHFIEADTLDPDTEHFL